MLTCMDVSVGAGGATQCIMGVDVQLPCTLKAACSSVPLSCGRTKNDGGLSGGPTSWMMAVRLANARRWSWYTSRANPLRTIFTNGECSTAKSASARLNPEVLILASAAACHTRA